MSSSPTPELPSAIDPDLESGHVVGEYRIDGKLGQGAFGTVYRAVHPLIDKLVAIKVLGRKYSVDPEMVSRFIAEARAVNQIRNRNIIDIFSFGTLDDGRQYYVMEYLDGEPLDVLLDRVGKLPLAQALPILRGVAKALDAAHAKGIAHRDLKAENVFLATDPDGGVWPKLLDFGIAKLLAPEDGLKHKTRTGMPVGTPYYMSPEQCRGKDVDHRTDFYAFGVLCYRVLTGAYPFDADDALSILMQQLNVDAEPPSTHVPELDPAIDQIVLQLLAKDPAARPADLRTAIRVLEQAAVSAGIDVRPTASWDLQTGPLGLLTGPAALQTGPLATRTPLAMRTQLPPPSPPWWARASVIAGMVAAALVAGVAMFFALGPGDEPRAPEPPAHVPAPAVEPVPAAVAPPRPAPAPALTATTSAPASQVIVTVTGVPEGTEVLVGGNVVGAAPGPVQLARGDGPVVLTFRAEGHLPASRTVVPDGDKALAVALKKKPRRAVGKASTRDEIIDVFGGKP